MNGPIGYFHARALLGDDGRAKIWCQTSEVSMIKNALGKHNIDPESIDVISSNYRYLVKDGRIEMEEAGNWVEIDLGILPVDTAAFVLDDLVKQIRPMPRKK